MTRGDCGLLCLPNTLARNSRKPSEIKIYLDVLHDAVVDWKPDEAHSLLVVFDGRDRACIGLVMAEGADNARRQSSSSD